MIDGAMKMPEPIIEPTMSVVAENVPSRRSSFVSPTASAAPTAMGWPSYAPGGRRSATPGNARALWIARAAARALLPVVGGHVTSTTLARTAALWSLPVLALAIACGGGGSGGPSDFGTAGDDASASGWDDGGDASFVHPGDHPDASHG